MHTGWLGSPHFSQKKYNLYTTWNFKLPSFDL
jgi:hypothetical protein